MSQTPDHLDDELLSALIDGDTAAAEVAGAGADAAAHLRACDHCAGRQSELAAARAALAAAPVEPLDELTRRRLVATALEAAEAAPAVEAPAAAAIPIGRSRWARRHPGLIGSAAAVVLAVLVGVPFVLDNGEPGGGETLTALAPSQEAADSFLGDLGDLSERDRLRLRLSGVVSDTYASPPAEAGPSPAAGSASPAPLADASPGAGGLAGIPREGGSTTTISAAGVPVMGGRNSGRATSGGDAAAKSSAESQAAETATADQGFSSDPASRDRADTDRCVAALLNGPARGGKLTRSGTGTYQGLPAIVASFELSGGNEAFITDRSSCEVLDRFSV